MEKSILSLSLYHSQGGSLYEAIIITSSTDITRFHEGVSSGRHEVIVLTEHGCHHVGDVYISYCPICYQYHYEAYGQDGVELSAQLELGYSCLGDAIECLLRAYGSVLID